MTITGYSTALFSTWYFVEEWGIVFDDEIDTAIKDLCNKYAINFPVYRVLPGETVFNILAGQPLNR